MQVKKAVLWWLVTSQEHPSLTQDDMQIKALMPLAAALFPGINYYSVGGFSEMMRTCVIPALNKQFPALHGLRREQIRADEALAIAEVFPSRGYQWQEHFRHYLAS